MMVGLNVLFGIDIWHGEIEFLVPFNDLPPMHDPSSNIK